MSFLCIMICPIGTDTSRVPIYLLITIFTARRFADRHYYYMYKHRRKHNKLNQSSHPDTTTPLTLPTIPPQKRPFHLLFL